MKVVQGDKSQNKEPTRLRLKVTCMENENCLNTKRFTSKDLMKIYEPFDVYYTANITSLGEERANLSAFRTFVRFVLV